MSFDYPFLRCSLSVFMFEFFLLSSTLLISLHTHTNEKVKHDDTTRKTFSCDLVEVFPFCHFVYTFILLHIAHIEVSKRLSGAIVKVSLHYTLHILLSFCAICSYFSFHIKSLLLSFCLPMSVSISFSFLSFHSLNRSFIFVFISALFSFRI